MKTTLLAFVMATIACVALGGSVTAALADDYASLEERVSELEATTVQKGNRKLSLTLSGWVAEQIVGWDDGVESDVYFTGLGTAFASNFNLSGRAEIVPGWEAGFLTWVETDGCDVYTTDQNTDCGAFVFTGETASPQVLYTYWFIESEKYGKISLGQHSPADDSAVVAIDASGTLAAAYWVGYDIFSFKVQGGFPNGQSMIWGNAVSCRGYGGGPGDCNGVPLNVVRYDTPSFNGFSGTVSFGADDNWAMTGRYIGQLNDNLKLSAVGTYSETTDDDKGAPRGGALKYTQAAVYFQHVPSGFFTLGAYGYLDQSSNVNNFPSTDTWYFKSGLRMDLVGLGATIPYGEYLVGNDGALVNNANGTFDVVDGSEAQYWGTGVVQEIDAAAMSMWLRYRHHDLDLPGIRTKDIQTVVFGSFLSF